MLTYRKKCSKSCKVYFKDDIQKGNYLYLTGIFKKICLKVYAIS